MAIYLVIGIIAGLTAAALYATVATGAAVALVLFYIAPLPLFIAGLGWGSIAAIAGGIAGASVLALTVDPKLGAVFAVTVALAPAFLSHLALKSRELSAANGTVTQSTEWYPEGHLVMWTASLAILLVGATLLLTGIGPEQLKELLGEMMKRMNELGTKPSAPLTPEVQAQMTTFIGGAALFIPAISASVWIIATLVNMLIASRILNASGRNVRVWAPFRTLTLPPSTILALGLAIICALLVSGILGLIAKTAAMALATVTAILGLATFHYLVHDHPMRTMLLTGVYVLIFAFTGFGILPLIVLAIAEMIFGLRARKGPLQPTT
jgi:uncharacterized protein YybS (DUF2232 family)